MKGTHQARVSDPHLDVEVGGVGEIADQGQTAQAEEEDVQAEEGNHVARTTLRTSTTT